MLFSTMQFTNAMDAQGIKYEYEGTTDSGADKVRLRYNCENISTLTLQFFFDRDCESAGIRVYNLVKFPESKLASMLFEVHKQSSKFRFMKFIIDMDDYTVQCEADAIFRKHDIGDICLEYLSRCLRICDRIYPEFMKVIWG